MSEKTSEEKLREELERDSLMGNNARSTSEGKSKSSRLRGVRHRVSSGNDTTIGQRVDSFIDEFERKIEDSLSGVNVRTSSSESSLQAKQDKPRVTRKVPAEKSAAKGEHVKPEGHEHKPDIPASTNRDINHETSEEPSRKELEPHETEKHLHEETEQPVIIDNTSEIQQVMTEDKPAVDEYSDITSEQKVPSRNKDISAHEEPKQPVIVDTADDAQQVIPEDKPVVDVHSNIANETEHPVIVDVAGDVQQVIPEDEHSDIHESEQQVMIDSVSEIPQVIPEIEPEPNIIESIPVQIESMNEIPQIIPEAEPMTDEHDDIADIDVREEPEHEHELISEPEGQTEPEVQPESESEDEELPDIPLIDAEDSDEEDEELPDIPVISPDEVDDPDENEELEEFDDIPVLDAEPELESEDEPQEQTEHEEPQDESDEITDDNMPADIVLNVDSDLPQITDEPEEEPDPESESAPVTVTMPETIKTAEDKLMADIAEAFTGNPLTLESREAPEPYRLPEDFFTSQNNDPNNEQSAEDKLKANIAQAISESPIGIAQKQAMQDLEQDLNPFEDLSLSELAEMTAQRNPESEPEPESELQESESDSEPELESEQEIESQEEPEEHEEAFLPDFTDEEENITADPEDFHDISEQQYEDASSPFDVESHDEPDEHEQDLNLDELPLSDDVNDDIPDDEPMVESDSNLEVISLDKPEQEQELEPEPEALTAQQRLEQEIAQFTQDAPEESIDESKEESINTDMDTQQEEVSPENDMPDTLLDGTENDNIAPQDDDEIGDDWDINSLGIISEAASIPDDEPEHEPEPEPELEPSFMTEPTEETHKEKTMGLREKLAAKKNGTSSKDSSAPAKKSSSSSSGGGILMPLLLFLLLAVGALTLWQLYSLPDRLASVIAMNSGVSGGGVFDSVSGTESTPSYDYAIDFILDPNIVERMSRRGKDGWQVVGSRRTQDSTTGQYGYEIIFMKRISGR